MKRITKSELFMYVIGAFVACLLISNVMAAKQFQIGPLVLTSGAILFPVVYIINDVLAEIYGFKRARKVIFLGFALNAFAVAAYGLGILLPAPEYATVASDAFAMVLGNTWRVLLASFAAYLAGSLSNAYIMERMKGKSGLMARCVTSTLVGEGLDGIIFVSVAFIGLLPAEAILTMIAGQIIFKTGVEIILYPVTKSVIEKVRALPE